MTQTSFSSVYARRDYRRAEDLGSPNPQPIPFHLALAVIALFTADRSEWTAAELATETALSDLALRPILRSLCESGLLAYDQHRQSYFPGIRSLELASGFRTRTPLCDIAEPVLESLRARFNETAMLAVRWGDYRVSIAQALSSHPLHQDIPLGKRKPLYIGAGGKILLASLDDVELANYLARISLDRASPTTTTDRIQLIELVAEIRESGFAETFSERNSGGASFGAAVRDGGGAIIAALVLSMPLQRYRFELRDRIKQLLISGAGEISARHTAWTRQ
jgi:DNA-binding IclR family transcriptional regulator